MSGQDQAARAYAKAAFAVAIAEQTLPLWHSALQHWASRLAEAAMVRLVRDPTVAREVVNAELLTASEVTGNLELQRFMEALGRNRRWPLLPLIAKHFGALAAEQANDVTVTIVSAEPLAEAEQTQLVAALSARLANAAQVTWNVDSSLIGGVVIRMGDQVIDGSVRNQLDRLRRSFTSPLVGEVDTRSVAG